MIKEEIFRSAQGICRPFSEAAGVTCRGYSLLLQRRITDLGSEKSFARAARQVKEHYGLEVGASTVRRQYHSAQYLLSSGFITKQLDVFNTYQ